MNTRCWIVALALAGWVVSGATAQLTPENLYYGVDRRVPVRVDAPEGFLGELTIRLHEVGSGAVVAESAAAAGRADLAGLLPELWEQKSGVTRLAQLYADGAPLGPPVVVQPLVTPNTAMLVDPTTMRPSDDPRAQPVFEDDRLPALAQRGAAASSEREVAFSGLRLYVDKEVVFETDLGAMVFRMRPDQAPNTVFNLLHLVEGGFYDGVAVHRVVARLPDGRPFVVQFGDPSGTGSGGPGYAIDLEKSALAHDFGVLSMARAADPNSNGSQVFVCLSREGTAFLDGRYTAFAEAIEGAETIRAIAAVPVGEEDRPVTPPVIERAYTRDAAPAGLRGPALSATPGPEAKAPER
jgi:peptidyl-prolyl cis-trans isomerase B (cyclophilin B)